MRWHIIGTEQSERGEKEKKETKHHNKYTFIQTPRAHDRDHTHIIEYVHKKHETRDTSITWQDGFELKACCFLRKKKMRNNVCLFGAVVLT